MSKVLIACGASGGHIFPAVSLGTSIASSEKNAEILFVGSKRYLDIRIFTREALRYRSLSSNKFSSRITLGTVWSLAKLAYDCLKALLIIASFRPQVIVGFGGYISFPVVLMGKLAGVKVVVHEQNVAAGRANAILFMLADAVALSFKETLAALPPRMRKKATVTGNPIRREFLRDDRSGARRRFGFDDSAFTILVVGGSQGARRLNAAVVDALAGMGDGDKRSLRVVHIAGERDHETIAEAYKSAGVTAATFAFIDRIDEAYSACDMAISRSGSAALFELAFYGKPMVLVPYPFAMNHQKENAAVFERQGAAFVCEEKDLTAEALRSLIEKVRRDPERLGAMSRCARSLGVPDAAERLAAVVRATGTARKRSDAQD